MVQPYSWFDFYFPLAFLKTSKYGENWTSASIRHLKYQKNHSRQKGLMILDIQEVDPGRRRGPHFHSQNFLYVLPVAWY